MPVAVWIPEPWGRNPGGAEGGGELLAALCCTALMALGGLVLLFWMLTFFCLCHTQVPGRDLLLVQPTLGTMPRGAAL